MTRQRKKNAKDDAENSVDFKSPQKNADSIAALQQTMSPLRVVLSPLCSPLRPPNGQTKQIVRVAVASPTPSRRGLVKRKLITAAVNDAENADVPKSPRKSIAAADRVALSPLKCHNQQQQHMSPLRVVVSPLSPTHSPLQPPRSPANSPLQPPSCETTVTNGRVKTPTSRLTPVKRKLITPAVEDHSPKKTPLTFTKCSTPVQKENINPATPVQKENINPATPMSVKQRLLQSRLGTPLGDGNSARAALHTSIPERLVCRDAEMETMREFLERSLRQSQPASMYVSGAPGTGKTACLSKVLDGIKATGCKKFESIFVNCMALKFSKSIYAKLASILTKTDKLCSEKQAHKVLQSKFTSKGPMILLTLDEIDQLEKPEILYKLFEMPFLPNSRLTLIGIANSLDLTDRILPRLHSSETCRPILLQFSPYTKDEIADILTERVKEISSNVVDASAIQFCARKVSAMSGDVRKALDIMRRAVEMVDSPSRTPSGHVTGRVSLPHIAAVCNQVYGSRLSSSSDENATIPLQQKILICTLFAQITKEKKSKDIVMGKLHEAYCRVCSSRQISSVSFEELISMCEMLETRGLIGVKKSKQLRNNSVSLRLQESELEHALQDKTLLSSILVDQS